MWKHHADQISDQLWKELEYTVPYQEWHDGTMTNLGRVDHSVRFTAGNSSIGAVRLLMELNGYSADLAMYEQLKSQLPNAYGMFKDSARVGRYAMEFRRDPLVKKHLLGEDIIANPDSWNQHIINWKDV